MNILALEFSSHSRAAAMIRFEEDSVSMRVLASISESLAGSLKPLRLVDRVLREAALTARDVDRIAIGLGPGSYTGVRSAIAIAQGWQLAYSIPTVGIGSMACLASQAQAKDWHGRVYMSVDAQRNEVYFAGYEINPAECVEMFPLRIISPEQARSLMESAPGRIIGPDVTRWFPKGTTLLPDAVALGQMAASQKDFTSAEALEPIYLREANFVKAPPPRTIPSLDTETN